jgi:hypothetical protein
LGRSRLDRPNAGSTLAQQFPRRRLVGGPAGRIDYRGGGSRLTDYRFLLFIGRLLEGYPMANVARAGSFETIFDKDFAESRSIFCRVLSLLTVYPGRPRVSETAATLRPTSL